MSFILTYLKKYKIRAILAPLFKMLEAIFELLVPLVMASIINKGIASSDTHYIIRMSGVLLLLAVVGLVFSLTAQYFSANVAVYAAAEIRRDLFAKILSLSQGTKEKIGDEVLTTRITNDINQIQNAINMVLRLFLRSPFIVFGATIMAFIVDVKSALIFLLVVGVLSLIVFIIMKYTLPRYKTIAARLEKVLHATSENLEGARVLRAFNQVDKEKKGFEAKTGELASMQISTGKISALLNPVTYVAVNLGIVLLIYVSMRRVDGDYILQGDVVALVNYMSQILVELIKLANLIVLLMKAFPSADRVQELMEMKSDERIHLNSTGNTQNENAGSIQLSNVSFSYNGTNDYDVEDITLDIPAGSVLGVIGGTGSGKSTLLKLMNHTYDASKGQVFIDGTDVKSMTDGELSNLFGIVPQKASLFSGTIKSNMTMKKQDADDEEIKSALNIAQALDFVEAKEGGINAEVSGKGTNFSGGQRQRLTIARALVGQPRILVLDDSASALDLATEAKLRKALQSLPWKPTIILVSQRASSVMDADQILVLEDGKAVGLGTHSQLLESCDTYQEIYYCQFPREEACNE
ncbi:ABC-type multidrug transport system, ATPase and permease component [Pseudobutyrivibrio ruminis]|uniref:ABC-type multidrug transport system, ATPase and permease component n=1 Tax=Pseudobutyrivibrio ruminis TaxID=46206 RepID=A0A1H7GUV0_9FIRM|nr:ABC transporter ATP-binding protein [Pseudobutyrivibrio ruminis]SEK41804.1 ABC-type multidrug transport system, ATPase and permease component [Pseudobutyrivibrio ruminis]